MMAGMPGRRFGGYVLAGGKSSRMGTDKALLVLDGETLLERTARAVQDAVGSAMVVGDPTRHAGYGFAVIADLIPGAGPLGGIHAALTHAAGMQAGRDWSLIVACDMPGLAGQRLAQIVEAAERDPEADVVIPESYGQLQPLCAVYRTRILPRIEVALRRGQFKLTTACEGLRMVRLPMRADLLFQNVNTPEEWSAVARG